MNDPRVLAGRYTLLHPLGQGSYGAVWYGRDRLSPEPVAVKLLSPQAARAWRALRQELTALRWLRLPGVVRLLDDGVEQGQAFLVMEHVEGLPFPGAVQGWPALAAPLRDLCAVLARVHQAGVLHRDLKPANVLLRPQGQVCLLDFGLASGAALAPEDEDAALLTTPLHAAPELCRGEMPGSASDLYAVGLMVYEALSGELPHASADPRALVHLRGSTPAPSLGSLRPELPRALVELVDALLALDPRDRPGSAQELLQALGEAPHPATKPLPKKLQTLFGGPDRFLHRDEDAARLLRARGGPDPQAQAQELAAWQNADLARMQADGRLLLEPAALASLGSGLRLDQPTSPAEQSLSAPDRRLLTALRLLWPHASRPHLAQLSGLSREDLDLALDRLQALGLVWPLPGGMLGATLGLEPVGDRAWRRDSHERAAALLPGTEASLRHLALAGARPARVLQALRVTLPSSSGLSALALQELGLQLARDEEDPEAEGELLAEVLRFALDEESLPALDRALYELGRRQVEDIGPLETLLYAARAALSGEGERALALLAGVPPLEQEPLERWRVALQVLATRALGAQQEQRLLDSLESWAQRSPERAAQHLSWLGSLAYRQGRYAEAAAAQQAAAQRRRGLGRIASLRSAAAAMLEVPSLDQAEQLARSAAREARRARHARYESLSLWIARNAAYRSGRALRPQPVWAQSAAPLGPLDQGLWSLIEASVAWRHGPHRLGAQLARSAADCFGRCARPQHQLLAQALAQACGEPLIPSEQLQNAAFSLASADIAVQVLGLLRGPEPPPWLPRLLALAQARPQAEWGWRLDLMSYEEALQGV